MYDTTITFTSIVLFKYTHNVYNVCYYSTPPTAAKIRTSLVVLNAIVVVLHVKTVAVGVGVVDMVGEVEEVAIVDVEEEEDSEGVVVEGDSVVVEGEEVQIDTGKTRIL